MTSTKTLVQRAASHALHGAAGAAYGRDPIAAYGRDHGAMGSTWGFDVPCTQSIGLERGDRAP